MNFFSYLLQDIQKLRIKSNRQDESPEMFYSNNTNISYLEDELKNFVNVCNYDTLMDIKYRLYFYNNEKERLEQ